MVIYLIKVKKIPQIKLFSISFWLVIIGVVVYLALTTPLKKNYYNTPTSEQDSLYREYARKIKESENWRNNTK